MINKQGKEQLRVLIADDHEVMRAGICDLLALTPDIKVVAAVPDGLTALEKIHELMPDVAVIDVRMSGMNGIEATSLIKARHPSVRVLCMSVHHEPQVVDDALAAGACGYILKVNAAEELVKSIRAAAAGEKINHPGAAS